MGKRRRNSCVHYPLLTCWSFVNLPHRKALLVAATRSRSGASWQLVDRALAREFTLLLTVPLVLEYEAVLKREEHRKVHGLTVPQLDEVINSLVRVAEPVRISFLWRPFLTDPLDDMVLETAVNGRADLLVTFNQKDFVAAAKGFAHETLRPSRRSIDYVGKRNGENGEQGCETK